MSIVGIIEIAAGLLVLSRPKTGAWIVTAWLILMAIALIFRDRYFDVAARDLVMSVGTFALAKFFGVFTNKKPTKRAIA